MALLHITVSQTKVENMTSSLFFIRIFFTLLCIAFVMICTTTTLSGGFNFTNGTIGLVLGLISSAGLMSLDFVFKRCSLRSFNTALLGLFFGYLVGECGLLFLTTVLDLAHLSISSELENVIKSAVFLICCYVGMIVAIRSSEELHLSIPFIKFQPVSQKKKDILVDWTILTDSRIIDLGASGLLDHHLILPRFVMRELCTMSETGDEASKAKARRCLEVLKKLEAITTLHMRYSETEFPEIKDPLLKLFQLARLLDANIITADISRIQQSAVEGIRVINIHMLSNALKPITQTGESIAIKIQRYGKEPRQGVGYLDDGTMVVVNGGAEFIGELIRAQVLSVKHTSSGRMIFCNTMEEEAMNESDSLESSDELEHSSRSYFTV